MEYLWIQVHRMFCEVSVMVAQTQLQSVVVGELLVKFLLKRKTQKKKNKKPKQDLQVVLHDFGYLVLPVMAR